MTAELLTWFGGFVGVRWAGDAKLHLLVSGEERHDSLLAGVTFCGIHARLRLVTALEANRAEAAWCFLCWERGWAAQQADLAATAPEGVSGDSLADDLGDTQRRADEDRAGGAQHNRRAPADLACGPEDVDESAGQRERLEGLARVTEAQEARMERLKGGPWGGEAA
jgi:hypothetical protein